MLNKRLIIFFNLILLSALVFTGALAALGTGGSGQQDRSLALTVDEPTGQISGSVFHDFDADGVYAGEDPLGDWQVELWQGTNRIAVTQTNSLGQFAFPALAPGWYTVTEDLPPLWFQTVPTYSQGVDFYTIQITSSATISDIVFGNFKLAQVSGYKFDDKNANGRYEPTIDHLLANWPITIDGMNFTTYHEETLTDKNGNFSFNVPPGDYWVWEHIPPGVVQTVPGYQYGEGYLISAESGSIHDLNKFGNIIPGDLYKTYLPIVFR